MPWGYAAVAAGSIISGSMSASASKKAAKLSAEQQERGLDYAKEINAPVVGARNKALEQYQAFLGLGDQPSTLIEDVRQSPFYSAMVDEGQQGLAAGLSATGGLRTGGANEAFAGLNQRVLQNLVNQRLSGLQSLSMAPINTSGVQSSYTNIGNTQAMGGVAAANAMQQGYGGALQALIPAISQINNGGGSSTPPPPTSYGNNGFNFDWNLVGGAP